jgi:hypothetical protein
MASSSSASAICGRPPPQHGSRLSVPELNGFPKISWTSSNAAGGLPPEPLDLAPTASTAPTSRALPSASSARERKPVVAAHVQSADTPAQRPDELVSVGRARVAFKLCDRLAQTSALALQSGYEWLQRR